MSPYPIPCALMRMVAISWTWLCLCEQAELSLPVLWHPCKLPFLQIPFVQPGAHLSIEGWQGRGWTLLTSLHLHNPPPQLPCSPGSLVGTGGFANWLPLGIPATHQLLPGALSGVSIS